jgi:hypothetical protein
MSIMLLTISKKPEEYGPYKKTARGTALGIAGGFSADRQWWFVCGL